MKQKQVSVQTDDQWIMAGRGCQLPLQTQVEGEKEKGGGFVAGILSFAFLSPAGYTTIL